MLMTGVTATFEGVEEMLPLIVSVPVPDLLAKDEALADQLKDTHEFLNMAMLALVVLHVAAALKHHVMDRDDVLARMLPLVKPRGKNP